MKNRGAGDPIAEASRVASVKTAISTGDREVLAIQKQVKLYAVEKPPAYWLPPDNPRRNALSGVFGDPKRGIPYGKILQVFGRFSGGKTGVGLELAAEAQDDGAAVALVDLEIARDPRWEGVRGLNSDLVVPFQAQLVQDSTKSKPRMITAEEIFALLHRWVDRRLAKNPHQKLFILIDSVPAIVPRSAMDGSLEGGQRALLAAFMSKLLNRWVPIAWTHNIMMVFINQVRMNPGARFQNPEYRPGGQGLEFYSSVIVRVRREGKEHGWVLQNGKRIGIRGVMINVKNKVGGLENETVGYKLYYHKRAKFFMGE